MIGQRRNQPCPCGSGKRLKQCCGLLTESDHSKPGAVVSALKARALDLHRTGELQLAEQHYRAVLEQVPVEPDCLHMLGVVLYSQGHYKEAARLIRSAGEATGWTLPGILRNFCLVMGAQLAGRFSGQQARLRLRYDLWLKAQVEIPTTSKAICISVILLGNIRSEFIGQALDSVFSQTYRNIELIVIEDEATGTQIDLIDNKLKGCPWPYRRIDICEKGLHATVCQAILAATGDYFNLLTPDDQFAPERLATLAEAIIDRQMAWGFTGCQNVDRLGQMTEPGARIRLRPQQEIEYAIHSSDTIGIALLSELNPVVGLGNLFFSRSLFEMISPHIEATKNSLLREYCLHMLWHTEPGYLPPPLYLHRLTEATLTHSLSPADDLGALHSYLWRSLEQTPPNPYAPARMTMGFGYLSQLMSADDNLGLSPEFLTRISDEIEILERAPHSLNSAPPSHGLSIFGYFRGDFALAEGVRTLALTCESHGIPASYRDVDYNLGSRQTNRSMDSHLCDDLPHKNVVFYMNPDVLVPARQRHSDRGELADRRLIGYWYWEIDALPKKWLAALDLLDEVWVATDFVGQLIQRETRKPVIKIPYAIDVSLSRPYQRHEFALPEGPFLFLFSFDFGSFAERKNPWATIHAFQLAFPSTPQVGLVIKCTLGYKHPKKLQSLLELARQDPRIVIIDRLLSREQVYGLQNVCDAYVSLHRSEGLGLGMAECMAQGKPVIATAYSGNLEFMTPENSCLVDYTLIPVKPGEYVDYEPGWLWAEAHLDHAAELMRRIVADDGFRSRISVQARADIATRFSHQAAAAAISKRLAELAA